MLKKNESYKTIDGSIEYVIKNLQILNSGKETVLDFLCTDGIGRFCTNLGFKRNWAKKSFDELANVTEANRPRVIPKSEAAKILEAVNSLILGTFKNEIKNNILDDFLSKNDKLQLGHLWEFQYALGVELEHGITRGTNVSNNHPLITGFIVMAHLTEDSLYYARLWVMEVQGEIFNLELANQDTTDLKLELKFAKQYLNKRLKEKRQNATK